MNWFLQSTTVHSQQTSFVFIHEIKILKILIWEQWPFTTASHFSFFESLTRSNTHAEKKIGFSKKTFILGCSLGSLKTQQFEKQCTRWEPTTIIHLLIYYARFIMWANQNQEPRSRCKVTLLLYDGSKNIKFFLKISIPHPVL